MRVLAWFVGSLVSAGQGFTGQVIVGGAHVTHKAYYSGAIAEAAHSANADRYFYTFGGMGSDTEGAVTALLGATQQRVFSTGTHTCQIGVKFYDAVKLAALNEAEGVTGGTAAWTTDKQDTMRQYIRAGATMFITNQPGNAIAAVLREGGRLAPPGSLPLRTATKDTFYRAAFDKGEPCWSDQM